MVGQVKGTIMAFSSDVEGPRDCTAADIKISCSASASFDCCMRKFLVDSNKGEAPHIP